MPVNLEDLRPGLVIEVPAAAEAYGHGPLRMLLSAARQIGRYSGPMTLFGAAARLTPVDQRTLVSLGDRHIALQALGPDRIALVHVQWLSLPNRIEIRALRSRSYSTRASPWRTASWRSGARRFP